VLAGRPPRLYRRATVTDAVTERNRSAQARKRPLPRPERDRAGARTGDHRHHPRERLASWAPFRGSQTGVATRTSRRRPASAGRVQSGGSR
jgi:hypothetical protein